MIITCPSCAAKFKIKPEMIGAGKNLTCAKCKHKWYFQLPAPELALAPAPAPAPEPSSAAPTIQEIEAAISEIATAQGDIAPPVEAISHLAAQANPAYAQDRNERSPGNPLRRAWLLFALLLVTVVASIASLREPLIAAWPPAARIYDVLGMPLPVLGEGLSFGPLRFEIIRIEEQDEKTGAIRILPPQEMAIHGTITNTTDHDLFIPPMLLDIYGADNIKLSSHPAQAKASRILPGETIPFVQNVPLIREQDLRIAVQFTTAPAAADTH